MGTGTWRRAAKHGSSNDADRYRGLGGGQCDDSKAWKGMKAASGVGLWHSMDGCLCGITGAFEAFDRGI